MASEPRTQSKQYDYLLKFLLVGDSDVGKQEILSGLENGPSEFCSGSAYKTTTILLDGKRVKLQLWDTSGQGRFCTIIRSYSRGAQGILLVYDITNKWSFDGIGRWLKEVDEHAPGVPKVLVGNRLHLAFKRQVGAREAESYAIKNRMAFFEVSPLCNFNIRESFSELSRMALHRNGMERLLRSNKVLSLQELCCRTIVARTTVYSIEQLPLPETIKSHLKSYAMTSYSSASMLPRCTRSNTVIQNKTNSGLIDHYRNLCKNLKCFIHRQNKTKKKRNNLTDDIKSVTKWKSSGVLKGEADTRSLPTPYSSALLQSYSQCKVEDFEDEVDNDSKEIIDHELYLQIESTIMDLGAGDEIKLQDVVGTGFLKETIDRTIIWPMKKPNVFKGLRSAPKGVLLFGPPGTGKTLIGKSIALETDWTFFNISSSSLLSKWMGESEKLVRTMFAVAKARQPSLIFIDEVDSLLGYRSPDEDVSSRRIKNEFLENMDGCSTEEKDRIMIIGATNRPQELDEAARQRFIKRLYIPLPDETSRKQLLENLLESECHSLEEDDIIDIVKKTEGFSLADIKSLGQEAAMGPIKSLASNAIIHLKEDRIRPISIEDFMVALQLIKPSVTKEEIETYEIWNSKYGYYDSNNERNRTKIRF